MQKGSRKFYLITAVVVAIIALILCAGFASKSVFATDSATSDIVRGAISGLPNEGTSSDIGKSFVKAPLTTENTLVILKWLPYLAAALIVVTALVVSGILIYYLVHGDSVIEPVVDDGATPQPPTDSTPTEPGASLDEDQDSNSYHWFVLIGIGALMVAGLSVLLVYRIFCRKNEHVQPIQPVVSDQVVDQPSNSTISNEPPVVVQVQPDNKSPVEPTNQDDGVEDIVDGVDQKHEQDVPVPNLVPPNPSFEQPKTLQVDSQVEPAIEKPKVEESYDNLRKTYLEKISTFEQPKKTHEFTYHCLGDGMYQTKTLLIGEPPVTVLEACRLLNNTTYKAHSDKYIIMPFNKARQKVGTYSTPKAYGLVRMSNFDTYNDKNVVWLKRILNGNELLSQNTIKKRTLFDKLSSFLD